MPAGWISQPTPPEIPSATHLPSPELIAHIGRSNNNLRSISMSKTKTPMNQKAASRIQSNTAQQQGGKVSKGSFSARATRAAARNGGK